MCRGSSPRKGKKTRQKKKRERERERERSTLCFRLPLPLAAGTARPGWAPADRPSPAAAPGRTRPPARGPSPSASRTRPLCSLGRRPARCAAWRSVRAGEGRARSGHLAGRSLATCGGAAGTRGEKLWSPETGAARGLQESRVAPKVLQGWDPRPEAHRSRPRPGKRGLHAASPRPAGGNHPFLAGDAPPVPTTGPGPPPAAGTPEPWPHL